MPTTYPKSSPTEMLGLLVLLNSHNGAEDVARLADDLDLEIDEILPSLEFASILQFVKVSDGRATFTELGKKLMTASIRNRKTVIRDQLRKTALFRTLVRALENSPTHTLSDEELNSIVSLTTAPADEAVQNIVNWGRYADLFRYDADEHCLILVRHPTTPRTGGSRPPPPSDPVPAPAGSPTRRPAPSGGETKGTGFVPALA